MNRHWNCTKFADKIRGIPKLKYGTLAEWEDWNQEAQKNHPIRYWLVEKFIPSLNPFKLINSIRYYFNNRWIIKTHALTSKLKKGQWYDLDNRIINCLFDELVNFVEIETAWIQSCFSENKYKRPFWLRRKSSGWRCAQAGIDLLNWRIKDHSCEHSKIILELYDWWTKVRPSRQDSMDASGWSEYCDKHDVLQEKQTEKSDEILNKLAEIEKAYDDEDEMMLIKLIKVRSHLWT